jgi:hypothetical protein
MTVGSKARPGAINPLPTHTSMLGGDQNGHGEDPGMTGMVIVFHDRQWNSGATHHGTHHGRERLGGARSNDRRTERSLRRRLHRLGQLPG